MEEEMVGLGYSWLVTGKLLVTLIGPPKCGKTTFGDHLEKYFVGLGIAVSRLHSAAYGPSFRSTVEYCLTGAQVVIAEVSDLTMYEREQKAVKDTKSLEGVKHVSFFWDLREDLMTSRGGDFIPDVVCTPTPNINAIPWHIDYVRLADGECPLEVLGEQEGWANEVVADIVALLDFSDTPAEQNPDEELLSSYNPHTPVVDPVDPNDPFFVDDGESRLCSPWDYQGLKYLQ